MEKHQELREQAKRNIQVADHMITMSYPMFKDPKILVSAVKTLLKAGDNAITSMLEYERLFKRIPIYHDSIDVKINLFKQKIMPLYKLSNTHLKLLNSLTDLSKAHKESSVEFPRKDKFIMCSETYEMRTLTIADLKSLIKETKLLVEDTYKVTSKNDRIFK
ncbi:hypothetical protein KO361_03505 [Candidatus Woesearchaeota archaeon]|nr:hypothetical protein [Candidatus Woesearchaeota archaeon]